MSKRSATSIDATEPSRLESPVVRANTDASAVQEANKLREECFECYEAHKSRFLSLRRTWFHATNAKRTSSRLCLPAPEVPSDKMILEAKRMAQRALDDFHAACEQMHQSLGGSGIKIGGMVETVVPVGDSQTEIAHLEHAPGGWTS